MTTHEAPPKILTDAELEQLYREHPMTDSDIERVKSEITTAYNPTPLQDGGVPKNAKPTPPQSDTIS